MDKVIVNFIDHIKKKCEDLNVNLLLSPEIYVELSENIKTAGYFEEVEDGRPTLVCSMGLPLEFWLPLLVHESCHMDQWAEQSPIWSKSDTLSVIDDWLEGNDPPKEELNDAFKNAVEIELDCEKRTLSKILEFNLPIDPKTYIQKSNAYLFFYEYVKKHRKWSIPGNPPYSEKIYPFAPNIWLDDYTIIPPNLEKAFDDVLGIKSSNTPLPSL